MDKPDKTLSINFDNVIEKLRALIEECLNERVKAQEVVGEWQRYVGQWDATVERLNAALTAAVRGNVDAPKTTTIQTISTVPTPTVADRALEEAENSKPESTPHKDIIADIIRRQGRSMSTSAIARQAHKDGTITSKKEYRGVYSSVTTTLKRYDKLLFIRVRRGLWDLRERRQQRRVFIGSTSIATQVSPRRDVDIVLSPHDMPLPSVILARSHMN